WTRASSSCRTTATTPITPGRHMRDVAGKKFLLITKPNCKHCYQAKKLLQKVGATWEERLIGDHVTREEVLAAYPQMRTVPIVVVDGELLGGESNLREWLDRE